MEIKQFQLNNIGRFEKLEVHLAPTTENPSNVTIFIGNNGSGKTSILKSLATSLSWFVARIKTEKGSGSPIPEEVIHAEHPSASVSVIVQDTLSQQNNRNDDSMYEWTIAKTKKGRKPLFTTQLNEATRLAHHYRNLLSETENTNLPLIAFYPVERAVLDIPLKIRGKHSFLQIDGYDNSLNQGVDFRRFFEWFREREDSENESGIPLEVLKKIEKSINTMTKDNGNDLWKQLEALNASSKDRQLTAVRTAISRFMPDFENLKVRRKPRLHMSIDKQGKTLNVLQLSQGEKSLIALVGDIARRLSMMNPNLENPLSGDGIVMIDEIDMHLHPTWQRTIIQRLADTFPNCQFVLTTHSPLVISDTKEILVYSLDEQLNIIPSQFGQDVNSVLLNVMDTNIRNEEIAIKLNNLLDLIQNSKLTKAKVLISELERELPLNNLELSKAKLLLRREELRSAKN